MSYCTQHIINIVSSKKLKLSDYVKLYEKLAEKVNSDFDESSFNFVFLGNAICDRNWNYGYGRDWPGFEQDMVKLSKVAKVELKCVWVGEDRSDTGFMHIKNGEIIENRNLEQSERNWFDSEYMKRK